MMFVRRAFLRQRYIDRDAKRFISGGSASFQDNSGSDKCIPSAEERRIFLNRLLYRSKQRGYLELDLVLGKWTEDNIRHLDDQQLQSLQQVLQLENPDLWTWLTGQAEIPQSLSGNPVFLAIQKQVRENLDSFASVETRAKPGQPWVRGWDDFRKIGPNNTVGNQ